LGSDTAVSLPDSASAPGPERRQGDGLSADDFLAIVEPLGRPLAQRSTLYTTLVPSA
jgi:2-iminoacetate synthase ThiH